MCTYNYYIFTLNLCVFIIVIEIETLVIVKIIITINHWLYKLQLLTSCYWITLLVVNFIGWIMYTYWCYIFLNEYSWIFKIVFKYSPNHWTTEYSFEPYVKTLLLLWSCSYNYVLQSISHTGCSLSWRTDKTGCNFTWWAESFYSR